MITASEPVGRVCGIPVRAVEPEQAAALLVQAGLEGKPLEVHLCNAFTLSLVDRDTRMRDALLHADLNLPDGTPVAWLLRRRGTVGPVRGPTLVRDVARLGAAAGLRHFLWGGAPGVAEEASTRLAEVAPSVRIVGRESPPYHELSDEELHQLAHRVRAVSAQIVWVGIGTPRQDYIVPRLAPLVGCPVVPVGAAFDFLAGRVVEAPESLRGSGLEWVHRLSRDPRRLWRRYLVGNPRFVLSAVRYARSGQA